MTEARTSCAVPDGLTPQPIRRAPTRGLPPSGTGTGTEMSPHLECSSCGAHWYSSVSAGAPCPACGGPLVEQLDAEVQTFIADVSSPETTIKEVRAALGELEGKELVWFEVDRRRSAD